MYEICPMFFFKPKTDEEAEPPTMLFSARKDKRAYLNELADKTKKYVEAQNENMARECLALAEIIFRYGDEHTRNLVSGIYVFAVSSFLEIRNINVSDLFPELLRLEYKRQINPQGL
jgi:hypothetical protein